MVEVLTSFLQVWFDKDAQIASAIKQHVTWQKQIHRDFEKAIASMSDIISQADSKLAIQREVKNEKTLCQNRLYALRLVSGLGNPAADSALADPCSELFRSPSAALRSDCARFVRQGEPRLPMFFLEKRLGWWQAGSIELTQKSSRGLRCCCSGVFQA